MREKWKKKSNRDRERDGNEINDETVVTEERDCLHAPGRQGEKCVDLTEGKRLSRIKRDRESGEIQGKKERDRQRRLKEND